MESSADPSRGLRPLGLGEILDRAVTLTVRYFIPLAAVYIVFAIVFEGLSYLANQDNAKLLQQLIATMKTGTQPPTTTQPTLSVWFFPLILVFAFAYPLVTAALIATASAIYQGRVVKTVEAYRVALNRYWHFLGINLMFLFTFGAVYFIVVFVAVFVVLLIAALISAARIIGIIISVLLGTVALVALIGAIALASIAYELSLFSCVVEGLNLAQSYLAGLRRTFTGIGLKRSLGAGLALFAIDIALSIMSLIGNGTLVGLVHSALLGAAFTVVLQVATVAFTTMFVAIFYFDLRVRTEGLDLEIAAQAAASSAPAT